MLIKYWWEDWDYWVDFHTNTPRDNSVTVEVSEEELQKLVTCTMCEIREKAQRVLYDNL